MSRELISHDRIQLESWKELTHFPFSLLREKPINPEQHSGRIIGPFEHKIIEHSRPLGEFRFILL